VHTRAAAAAEGLSQWRVTARAGWKVFGILMRAGVEPCTTQAAGRGLRHGSTRRGRPACLRQQRGPCDGAAFAQLGAPMRSAAQRRRRGRATLVTSVQSSPARAAQATPVGLSRKAGSRRRPRSCARRSSPPSYPSGISAGPVPGAAASRCADSRPPSSRILASNTLTRTSTSKSSCARAGGIGDGLGYS